MIYSPSHHDFYGYYKSNPYPSKALKGDNQDLIKGEYNIKKF